MTVRCISATLLEIGLRYSLYPAVLPAAAQLIDWLLSTTISTSQAGWERIENCISMQDHGLKSPPNALVVPTPARFPILLRAAPPPVISGSMSLPSILQTRR